MSAQVEAELVGRYRKLTRGLQKLLASLDGQP
jgi:hypothetical protein